MLKKSIRQNPGVLLNPLQWTSTHNKELPGPNVIGAVAEKPRVRKITAFFFSQPLYSLGFVLSSAHGFLCCFLDKLGNDWPNSSASLLSNVTFKLSHPNSTQYTLSLFPNFILLGERFSLVQAFSSIIHIAIVERRVSLFKKCDNFPFNLASKFILLLLLSCFSCV